MCSMTQCDTCSPRSSCTRCHRSSLSAGEQATINDPQAAAASGGAHRVPMDALAVRPSIPPAAVPRVVGRVAVLRLPVAGGLYAELGLPSGQLVAQLVVQRPFLGARRARRPGGRHKVPTLCLSRARWSPARLHVPPRRCRLLWYTGSGRGSWVTTGPLFACAKGGLSPCQCAGSPCSPTGAARRSGCHFHAV